MNYIDQRKQYARAIVNLLKREGGFVSKGSEPVIQDAIDMLVSQRNLVSSNDGRYFLEVK